MVVKEIRVKEKRLINSGISQQLNSIDRDTITPIPHIIELGLLDLLFPYRVRRLGGHNRIYP